MLYIVPGQLYSDCTTCTSEIIPRNRGPGYEAKRAKVVLMRRSHYTSLVPSPPQHCSFDVSLHLNNIRYYLHLCDHSLKQALGMRLGSFDEAVQERIRTGG